MKSILSLFIVLITGSILYAQEKKELTLDDFVSNYSFYAQSVHGVNSMNDGENFTSLVQGKFIVKYSYKTGEAVDTVF